MNTPHSNSYKAFLAPRYWPTWLGIGVLAAIAWMPHRLRLLCGSAIGYLSWALGRERRYITAVNISLCFPELSSSEQKQLVKSCFLDYGRGLIETATGWLRSPNHLHPLLARDNISEVIAAAAEEGRGALLLGAHYSTLDIGANFFSWYKKLSTTFRPHRNPLFNTFMYRGRARSCEKVFDRYDIRGTFRHLKNGGILWYAPDQDYGPEHAVFTPFFGNTAASITAPARFAAVNNSAVFILRQTRLPGNQGYENIYERLPESWPSGDDVADTALINEKLEQAIRQAPSQYLWMHKRFKTQQEGKPASPYINIQSPASKLDSEGFKALMARTSPAAPLPNEFLMLDNGQYLRLLSGRFRRFPAIGPGHRIDRNSRQLRMRGISTLTVDKWYRLKEQTQHGMQFHLPGANTLQSLGREEFKQSIKALADFLYRCHECGVSLKHHDVDLLLHTGSGYAVLYPEKITLYPTSLCHAERKEALNRFSAYVNNKLEEPDSEFTSAYLSLCNEEVRKALS